MLSLFSLVLSFDFFARKKETKESTSINYLKAGFPNLRFENDKTKSHKDPETSSGWPEGVIPCYDTESQDKAIQNKKTKILKQVQDDKIKNKNKKRFIINSISFP